MPLSARKVETALPGMHHDGDGLMLVVKPGGARSWILRYQLAGRRRGMGLGRWPETSLARAREKALAARQRIKDGRDPLAERDAERKAARARRVLTFQAAAEALIASKRPEWRNAKHSLQWGSTLAAYAFPALGGLDVKEVTTDDVLGVLRPIWTEKPETASRRPGVPGRS